MKYRIYVIEDDENIRNLICVALENFGYCASGFETAEEALDSLSDLLRRGREAQREYPAMFVFDWMLPGMDGMAAIRKIREMPDFAAAPVLMLTAKDREMDIVQGLDNGADDYMTKPFGILELSARVRNLLKRVEPAEEEVSSLTIGEVSINRETREVIACGDRTELTLKEFELLTYLMEHINRVRRATSFSTISGAMTMMGRRERWICTSRHSGRSCMTPEPRSRRCAAWAIGF